MNFKLTYADLKTIYEKKGYAFFDNGDFNLNIGAFRMSIHSDIYDDVFFVAYKEEGIEKVEFFECTTDPGSFYLLNPMSKDGAFIMVPGQYRGAYTPGPHGSTKYRALRQIKRIKGYRDLTKDTKHDLDPDTIQDGIFFTNIHHGWDSAKVGKNSAGCQVLRFKESLNRLLELVDKSIPLYGNKLTYTLMEKSDI